MTREEYNCRAICWVTKQDPDVILPKSSINPMGNLRNWEVMAKMGMGKPPSRCAKPHDRGKAKEQAYIARMIAETDPEPKNHDYHTSNK